MWEEGWGLKRGWHEGEEKAIRRGLLVKRCEKGWVEQEQVVTIVRCVDCGVMGTRLWGGPIRRYYDKNDLVRTTFETTGVQSARIDGRRRCET